MNEILFFAHAFLVLVFVGIALRMGKNALIGLVVMQAVLANLFVVKQMDFFGFTITCSDVFIVGTIFGLNLLQEYFGKEMAQKAMRICFFCLIFFVVMSQMHLLYAPTLRDTTHFSFQSILSTTPRIIGASIFTFYFVQQIDLRFFAWLQVRFQGQKLPLRMMLALIVSQGLDTLLFSFLGLYGYVESIFAVIVMSCLIKGMAIACTAPFTFLARRFVKEAA